MCFRTFGSLIILIIVASLVIKWVIASSDQFQIANHLDIQAKLGMIQLVLNMKTCHIPTVFHPKKCLLYQIVLAENDSNQPQNPFYAASMLRYLGISVVFRHLALRATTKVQHISRLWTSISTRQESTANDARSSSPPLPPADTDANRFYEAYFVHQRLSNYTGRHSFTKDCVVEHMLVIWQKLK